MNKYDLVKRLRKNCGLTEAEVEKLIKAKIDTFAEALAEGERGFLPGFRTFVSVARAARKGRNPKTGEALSLPAYNAIKFTAAKRRYAPERHSLSGNSKGELIPSFAVADSAIELHPRLKFSPILPKLSRFSY